jgi:hypothetical protein
MQIGGLSPGTEYDRIELTGSAGLAGTLEVALTGGFFPAMGAAFNLITYGEEGGQFASYKLPGAQQWLVSYGETALTLSVVGDAIPGDFNVDGVVDAADYTVVRDGLGVTYTTADYNTWRLNYGRTNVTVAGSAVAVPEPVGIALVFGIGLTAASRRR